MRRSERVAYLAQRQKTIEADRRHEEMMQAIVERIRDGEPRHKDLTLESLRKMDQKTRENLIFKYRIS